MYYLTDFKHFVSIFPSFSIQLTPFSVNFKFFDPSFLQKLRSDRVYFCFVWCTQVPKFYEVPPLPGSITPSLIDMDKAFIYIHVSFARTENVFIITQFRFECIITFSVARSTPVCFHPIPGCAGWILLRLVTMVGCKRSYS